jgi:uncharacterized membrane protein
MQPILINRNKADLEQQFNFLIRQEFIITYGRYKRFPLYLIGATFVILAVAFFTSTDKFIMLKGVSLVSIAIAWLIVVIFSVAILIKWIRRTKWRNNSINSFLIADTKAYMSFDNDKISFITDTYQSDINWEFYKYFGEDKTSIYIFPERNLYEALYFSAGDIGEENFKLLKSMAKLKLKPIEESNGI